MRISNINQICFEGRNLSLNEAREVCSVVRERYPYPSLWRVGRIDRPNAMEMELDTVRRRKVFSEMTAYMNTLGDRLDDLRHYYADFRKNSLKYYTYMIDGIKKFQTLNCGELSRLVYLTLRVNDVDNSDASVVYLESFDGGKINDLDHEIAQVAGENGLIGIDSLLGEAAELENLSDIYKDKYSFPLRISSSDIIRYKMSSFPRISDEEAAILKKKFTDLIL